MVVKTTHGNAAGWMDHVISDHSSVENCLSSRMDHVITVLLENCFFTSEPHDLMTDNPNMTFLWAKYSTGFAFTDCNLIHPGTGF